jgi:hypothetical protein
VPGGVGRLRVMFECRRHGRSGSILLFSARPAAPFWITVAGRSKCEPHAGEFVDWNRPADQGQPSGNKRVSTRVRFRRSFTFLLLRCGNLPKRARPRDKRGCPRPCALRGMQCRFSVASLAAPVRWNCWALGFCRRRPRGCRSRVALWARPVVVPTSTTPTGAFHRDERRICGIRDMPVTSERSGVDNEVGGGRTSSEPRLEPTLCVRKATRSRASGSPCWARLLARIAVSCSRVMMRALFRGR